MNLDSPSDRELREHMIDELSAINKKVMNRHVETFTVERTVARKGYRHQLPLLDDEAIKRYSEPRIKVTVIFEVPDDVTPGFKDLLKDLTAIERLGVRRALEVKLEAARGRAKAAQAEADRLQKEIDDA